MLVNNMLVTNIAMTRSVGKGAGRKGVQPQEAEPQGVDRRGRRGGGKAVARAWVIALSFGMIGTGPRPAGRGGRLSP